MKKNYYELLEVDKKASPEVIEKAYKTLVKKYHPDLQQGELKSNYEEILKHINEAYETLSDATKRAAYDMTLPKDNTYKTSSYNSQEKKTYTYTPPKSENTTVKQNVANQKRYTENINNSNAQNQKNHSENIDRNQYIEYQKRYNEEIQKAVNKAYHDAYIQDLKRRGFKIKYKKTKKDYITIFISIIITIFILFILWQIPFIRNYILNIYYNNPIIYNTFKIISNIFKT